MDLSIGGLWSGRIEEQCAKMDEHHTPLSKEQVAQLIRSLIVAEQVFTTTVSMRNEQAEFYLTKSDQKYVLHPRAKSQESWHRT